MQLEKQAYQIATISKYINGGNVLDKNREIIQAAIEELNLRLMKWQED